MTPNLNNPNTYLWALRVLIVMTIALIIALCSSCSCDWHIKRAKSKCGEVGTDVITLYDTIIVNSVTKDTVFKYFTKDTVIVKQKNLTVKYFYNIKDSTVYLKGNCKGDTVIKTIKVPYEKTVIKVDYFPKWIWWAIGIILALGIVLRLLKV